MGCLLAVSIAGLLATRGGCTAGAAIVSFATGFTVVTGLPLVMISDGLSAVVSGAGMFMTILVSSSSICLRRLSTFSIVEAFSANGVPSNCWIILFNEIAAVLSSLCLI